MTTISRRVALTIPNDLDSVLDRLCELQDRKKTQLITEYLMELKPAFELLADALTAVKEKKDPMKHMNALLAETMAKAGEIGSGVRELQKKCPDTMELPL